MLFDLHTHSRASDGMLTPNALLEAASAAGVGMLSITDHDTIAAYRELPPSHRASLMIIPGVEFSTEWRGHCVHVLGLNVDPTSSILGGAVTYQQEARSARAEQIAERLERVGLKNAYAGASAAADGSTIGRPHFARYMVKQGFVKDSAQAFRKYLGAGKIGDVKQHWASMEQIIDWIVSSGGVAVLAHPAKYKLTRTRRNRLIEEFRNLGGGALEVISGQQDPALTASLAAAARRFGLSVSAGSDFHAPNQPWAKLGMTFKLPPQLPAVWEVW